MKRGSGTAPHLLSTGLCPGGLPGPLSQQEQGGHHLLSTECTSLTMRHVLCMHFFILVAILWSRQQPQDCKPAEKFREEPKKESISGETGVAKGRTYCQRRRYNFHVFHHSNGLKV